MYREAVPVLMAVSPTLVPRPADWGTHIAMTGYWSAMHDGGWRPPLDLLRFLEAGPAPVCFGFGSMMACCRSDFGALIGGAVWDAGARAVVLTGRHDPAEYGLVASERVFVAAHVPHTWLLPGMAAMVHHGGAGTTLAAMGAGIASVAVPCFFDQAWWGRRISALGAGLEPLSWRTLTRTGLSSALRRLTGDIRLAARAHELSTAISAEDGVGCAIRVIESVAQDARQRGG